MKDPKIGLEEYANNLFMVMAAGDRHGDLHEDPADAIAEAEELADFGGVDFYVVAVQAVEGPLVHHARAQKAKAPKKRRTPHPIPETKKENER